LSAEITVKKDKTSRGKLNELREKRKNLITQVREHEKERDARRTARDELNKKVRELFDAARVERSSRRNQQGSSIEQRTPKDEPRRC